jgi:hypothetical protein
MISFLDLFKWDRFVATSFVELLFWLLTAVAVLLGITGVIGGVAQIAADPTGGLIAIAVSILGGLAGIVAARTLCEAVIMLFRVNENLMDIRDNLAPAHEPHAPAHVPPAPQFALAEPVEPVRSFADVLEQALAEPDPAVMMPSVSLEPDWSVPPPAQPRPPEPKSPETSSLEARLAEIRARREGVAGAASRAPAVAPVSSHPDKAQPSGSRGGFVDPIAPAAAAEPAPPAAVVAPDVKPSVRPAEPKRVEPRKTDDKKPDEAKKPEDGKKPDEAKKADDKKPAGKDAAAEPAPAEAQPPQPQPLPEPVDTLEDDITRALAREAEAAAEKPKAG